MGLSYSGLLVPPFWHSVPGYIPLTEENKVRKHICNAFVTAYSKQQESSDASGGQVDEESPSKGQSSVEFLA